MPDPKARCTHLTRRGRPCRNPAFSGTEPLACARHRHVSGDLEKVMAAGDRPPTSGELPSPGHFYFPHPTPADQRVLEAAGPEAGLRPEMDLVRVVLRRLLAYLDEAAGELPPEELRRVSGLVFTGARTVALLAGKDAARPKEIESWLADALAEIGRQHNLEL